MLTLPEAAAMLRCSVFVLRTPEWIQRLSAVKVAARWLVRAEAVAEVLNGKR
jgi:hypothetical protein